MFKTIFQSIERYAILIIVSVGLSIISYQQFKIYLRDKTIEKQTDRIETLEWDVVEAKEETEIKTTKVIIDYMKRKTNEEINATLSNRTIITGIKRL